MAEDFGRHNSNRWVKATVPSYGDEWGDDYGSGNDEEYGEVEIQEDIPEVDSEVENRDAQWEDIKPGSRRYTEGRISYPKSGLVLSIDNLKHRDDSDDLSDEEESPQKADSMGTRIMPTDNTYEGTPTRQVIDMANHKIPASVEPPTPTFSKNSTIPDTPQSERSFQSDDSLQHEPSSLNVIYKRLVSSMNKDIDPISEEVLQPGDAVQNINTVESGPHDDLNEINTSGRGTEAEEALDPLILSIDHRNVHELSDDSDATTELGVEGTEDNEEIILNPSNSSPIIDSHKHIDHSSEVEDESMTEEYNHAKSKIGEPQYPFSQLNEPMRSSESRGTENSQSHVEDLDNLINEMQKSSYVGRPFERPDNQLNEELDVDKESVMPSLSSPKSGSFSKEQTHVFPTFHENLDDYSEHSGEQTAPLNLEGGNVNERKMSVRKPPPTEEPPAERKNLVSADYTSIADAVSGYIHENDFNPIAEESEREVLDQDPLRNEDELAPPSSPLQPITSTGSLSTGRMTISPSVSNVNNKLNDIEGINESNNGTDEISRKTSLLSVNTINLGGWKPNTNNYRDQFINLNDNESHFNLNTNDSNYLKFTKVRSSSGVVFDNASRTSSVSIPETVDVILPSIHEHSDTESNFDTALNESLSNSIEESDKTTTTDPEAHKAKSSQRYSSLLDNIDIPIDARTEISQMHKISDNQNDGKRVASLESTASGRTLSAIKGKPKYNWKTIMAVSQPIDRIKLFKEALEEESNYDTGLHIWINATLKSSDGATIMHIGKIASEAYQNAPHNDLRRHISIRSKVSIMKDKVETSGHQASSLGKRFLSRGKKFIRSNND